MKMHVQSCEHFLLLLFNLLASIRKLKIFMGYGYQIEPAALNMLESLGDEKVIDVLDSFTDKFPDTIVIEGKQIVENQSAI
jgi:hypothetical protein